MALVDAGGATTTFAALAGAVAAAAGSFRALGVTPGDRVAIAAWNDAGFVRAYLGALWAGAVATGCTYAAWSFALRRLPAVVVAPFAYLIPVSALAIAHVWLGEALTRPVLVGAGLVLAGVAFSQASQFSLLLRARRKTTMKI